MSDPASPSGQEFGSFVGSVIAKWSDSSSVMELVEDFGYVDPSGLRWDAPSGSVIDGASIPRALWTVVGSPFTGEYRNGSVVHDVACVRKTKSWQTVHRMFYDAMRCGGVGEKRALFMYAAVFHFGPRWMLARRLAANDTITEAFAVEHWPRNTQQPSVDALEQLRVSIEDHNAPLTLRDVRSLEVSSSGVR
jgi:hypothetical protein